MKDDQTGQEHVVPTVEAQATYNALKKIVQFECGQRGGGNRVMAALATLLAEVVDGAAAAVPPPGPQGYGYNPATGKLTLSPEEYRSSIKEEALAIFEKVYRETVKKREEVTDPEPEKVVIN